MTLLALITYIKERDNRVSYRGFLSSHHDIIVTSIATSTFSDNWNKLDNLWAARFLYEGKDFADLKDKVHIFLFCKGRVTPMLIIGLARGITGFVRLVTTPSSQFRCPIFVVGKGLLVLEEEPAMYLPLSLNKKISTLLISFIVSITGKNRAVTA